MRQFALSSVRIIVTARGQHSSMLVTTLCTFRPSSREKKLCAHLLTRPSHAWREIISRHTGLDLSHVRNAVHESLELLEDTTNDGLLLLRSRQLGVHLLHLGPKLFQGFVARLLMSLGFLERSGGCRDRVLLRSLNLRG